MKKSGHSNTSRHQRVSKKGLPPGTHVYTGKHFTEKPEIEVYSYTTDACKVSHPQHAAEIPSAENQIVWINVNGINHVDTVQAICGLFDVHYLYQEDILNIFQRPKAEIEDKYIFMTFKSLEWDVARKHVAEEQISLILSENATISFQEKPGDHFDYIRNKLSSDMSVIRSKKADYLFYRLLDITVDSYFDLLENIGNNLEELENSVLQKPTTALLNEIQRNKKDLLAIRRNIYPLRDLLNKIINAEHRLIGEQTVKYFRDVQDHTVQIIEMVESYREMNFSLKDAYLNALSIEMNKVMKVLTIISTLFIPGTGMVSRLLFNLGHHDFSSCLPCFLVSP
jgi:magnesium transporter